MSADRWNAAIEAAAKVCEAGATEWDELVADGSEFDGYTAEVLRESAQKILALREAEDQRGAAATCTEGAIHVAIEGQMRESYVKPKAQSAPHPDIVLVPREILNSAVVMLEAEGDEHGVARFLRAAMRAAAPRQALASSDPEGHLQAMSDAELPASAEPEMVLVPREPSNGLLVSMAIRHDHGLGVPGYYGETHAQRLSAAIVQMRQIHEEAVGAGFYSKEAESKYAAMLAAAEDAHRG